MTHQITTFKLHHLNDSVDKWWQATNPDTPIGESFELRAHTWLAMGLEFAMPKACQGDASGYFIAAHDDELAKPVVVYCGEDFSLSIDDVPVPLDVFLVKYSLVVVNEGLEKWLTA